MKQYNEEDIKNLFGERAGESKKERKAMEKFGDKVEKWLKKNFGKKVSAFYSAYDASLYPGGSTYYAKGKIEVGIRKKGNWKELAKEIPSALEEKFPLKETMGIGRKLDHHLSAGGFNHDYKVLVFKITE